MPATKDKASNINKYRLYLAPFEDVHREIHRIPEPPVIGVCSANVTASHLEGLGGFRVHHGVGGRGPGNGPGSVILFRENMDALLHLEKMNLEYASTKIASDRRGNETPAMHACGHNIHMTSLTAAAILLHSTALRRSEPRYPSFNRMRKQPDDLKL